VIRLAIAAFNATAHGDQLMSIDIHAGGAVEADVSRSPDLMTVELQGRRFDVVKTVGAANFEPFWMYYASGLWEKETLAVIDSVPTERSIFLDVGGWIGPTALWAAFRQSTVVAFEPDPVALTALRANVAANPELGQKIRIIPAAAGSSAGDLDLYASRLGMSETSIFNVVERQQQAAALQQKITVPMVDLAQVIRDLSPTEHKIFIKIDIEGAEFTLLPHLANLVEKYDITICASLHGQNIVKDTPDRTAASRLLTVAKSLEPYKDMHWFEYTGESIQQVDKFPYLVKILNDLGHDAMFIASRSPL
jgi:FkbM family methyltransferase